MTTEHYAIKQVDSEDDADVTLKGDETHIAELLEYMDIQTLLQIKMEKSETERDDIDVEVIPHKGLSGFSE